MAEKPDKLARRSIWLHRARRFFTGLNVTASLLLAAAAFLLVNYLSFRYWTRWDLNGRDAYRLSGKTRSLIAGLAEPVEVISFFRHDHELFEDVRGLLREYEYEGAKNAPRRLRVEMVDPDRDMARTRELAKEHEVDDPNVVVFVCQGRRKYVAPRELAEYQYALGEGRHVDKKRTSFAGEQAFSSAIHSVAQARQPVIYFLTGHGERSIEDFSEINGYSSLATVLKRDNVTIRPLVLGATAGGVPADCSALVVAGPSRQFSDAEIELLNSYLNRNGRLLAMVEPYQNTGIEDLLRKWGARLDNDAVVGLSLNGRDLIVKDYGEHPITRNLRTIATMLFHPRSVEPAATASRAGDPAVDRPKVTVLASSTDESWAETDPAQRPPRYDEGVDRRGPIGVAVAIERGPAGGINVEIRPTRLVVIGDCDFVSNSALSTALGGNIDLFLSAINWLTERESLMAISPKPPGELRLDLSPEQWRTTYLVCVGAVPLTVLLLGLAVWAARRQ